MILIISNKYDPHVDKVIDLLNEKNIVFMRFNTEDFPQKIQVTWHNKRSGIDGEITFPLGRKILLSQITACWYRRPMTPKISTKVFPLQFKEFAQKESEYFLKGLWIYLSNIFWISYPEKVRQANSKMANLRLAQEIGFLTPSTLITNIPSEARNFYSRNSENIITKQFGFEGITYKRKFYNILTHKVLPEELNAMDQVEFTPTLFQKYIPKKIEIRTTIVGDKIFSCEIHSQTSQKTRDDWRNYDDENVKHAVHQLPKKIEAQCLEMMRRLGLNFGAFDFILAPDNKYVFLELNPNGQYLWVELLTGIPISRAVADLLIQHT